MQVPPPDEAGGVDQSRPREDPPAGQSSRSRRARPSTPSRGRGSGKPAAQGTNTGAAKRDRGPAKASSKTPTRDAGHKAEIPSATPVDKPARRRRAGAAEASIVPSPGGQRTVRSTRSTRAGGQPKPDAEQGSAVA